MSTLQTERLSLRPLVAVASQAVTKRLGLTYRRRVDDKGLRDIAWFDTDRETWTAR